MSQGFSHITLSKAPDHQRGPSTPISNLHSNHCKYRFKISLFTKFAKWRTCIVFSVGSFSICVLYVRWITACIDNRLRFNATQRLVLSQCVQPSWYASCRCRSHIFRHRVSRRPVMVFCIIIIILISVTLCSADAGICRTLQFVWQFQNRKHWKSNKTSW